MFTARKELNDLREENRKLKEELAEAREDTLRSAIINNAALPQCKSAACAGCKHDVVRYTTWGGWYVLGYRHYLRESRGHQGSVTYSVAI